MISELANYHNDHNDIAEFYIMFTFKTIYLFPEAKTRRKIENQTKVFEFFNNLTVHTLKIYNPNP